MVRIEGSFSGCKHVHFPWCPHPRPLTGQVSQPSSLFEQLMVTIAIARILDTVTIKLVDRSMRIYI
jgi:hypothetical protein